MQISRVAAALTLGLTLLGLLALPSFTTADAATGLTAQAGEVGLSVIDPHGHGDADLVSALERSDLLDEWLSATALSPQAALLEVTGGSEYVQARAALLDQLDAVSRRETFSQARSVELEQAQHQLGTLATVVDDVRQAVIESAQEGDPSLTNGEATRARSTLNELMIDIGPAGYTLIPMDLITARLARLQAGLLTEIDGLTSTQRSIAQITQFPQEVVLLRELIDAARATNDASLEQVAHERVASIDLMNRVHQLRLLARTTIAGLPVVTVDAYVQGSRINQDRCSIDWTLLAGIGRIESRHGTLDDATVLATGDVSTSIFGPLLDGGATKYEAEQLLAAEEEARLAEEEAERLAEIERLRVFDVELWGEDGLERVEEQIEATETGEANRDAEQNAEAEESEAAPPLFDPALWGDAAADGADASNESEELDGDEDEADDEEDEGPPGNGFAVIVDSDNGRLDGNDRWDRAVGPMQFIPETWSAWAIDGNNDGVADPQNLYDAAATAGRFLCHLQSTRGSSPYSFVLGYNASDVYVQNVMDVANELDETELPQIAQEPIG